MGTGVGDGEAAERQAATLSGWPSTRAAMGSAAAATSRLTCTDSSPANASAAVTTAQMAAADEPRPRDIGTRGTNRAASSAGVQPTLAKVARIARSTRLSSPVDTPA